jgi:hypothetical protein
LGVNCPRNRLGGRLAACCSANALRLRRAFDDDSGEPFNLSANDGDPSGAMHKGCAILLPQHLSTDGINIELCGKSAFVVYLVRTDELIE